MKKIVPGHDIIVIGASAGGVEALTHLVRALPDDLPAAIFVVLHIPSQSTSVLPKILNRAIAKQHKGASSLKASHPKDNQAIQNGQIYVAPPDHHLLVKDGYIRLARGPRENGHRPAVDPLFRTAARIYGQRVVGIVLSGNLDDGTAGLAAVKQRGGLAIVQDPDQALYSGMPCSAIENVEVDYILGVSQIARQVVELADQPVKQEGTNVVSNDIEMEADMAELEVGAMNNPHRPGEPSPYGCPDCGGVLWEIGEGKLLRFRCRTGHAYSTGTLMASQSEALEEALWNALRALEEKAALALRLGTRARDRNQSFSATRFEEQAKAAHERATIVRNMLLRGEGNGTVSNNHQVDTKDLLLEDLEATQSQSVVATLSANDLVSSTPPSLSVVAICASAGGLNAISQVLSALPADFPAAVTLVQHSSRNFPSMLPDILSRRIALSVKQAEEKDVLQPKQVYIAPNDQHLLVNLDGTISLSHSELVHFVRPSADLLFESVAASFRQQAIAVVLTGTGGDGAIGVKAIKQMGGVAIAQDQATSEFFAMPEAAINTGAVDYVVPLPQIADTLLKLVTVKDKV